MKFDFVKTSSAQSVLRLALYQTIYKINTFSTPSIRRDLIKLNLLSQYFLPNLFSIWPNVGSFTCHKLISNHTQCKEIYRIRVIHFANNLWSHISWSATCILSVIRLYFTRYPQVSDPHISSIIKN